MTRGPNALWQVRVRRAVWEIVDYVYRIGLLASDQRLVIRGAKNNERTRSTVVGQSITPRSLDARFTSVDCNPVGRSPPLYEEPCCMIY